MPIEKILTELKEETYAVLKPSPVHGIGVFAARDIPRGCRNIFSKGVGEWVKLPISKVEELPEHSKALVETYCLYDEEHYFVPSYGFKIMDMVNYLNHSSKPNLASVNDGEEFEAMRDIAAGEELLIDYNHIASHEEPYL